MSSSNWRTPFVILLCGGIILTLSLGTRHTFGLYLQPMTFDLGWSRQTFAIALAIQNLVYGLATPFAGMIADRYGATRALIGGTLLYALGIVLMAFSTTGWEFSLSAGLLVGIGLSCSGFSTVFGVVGRAFPPEKRTLALGIAASAGSFGQFLMLPYGQALMNHFGWHNALLICAVTLMLILPLSTSLAEDRKALALAGGKQSIPEALREAFGHSGYLLLCSGYFVCGFQLMFISVHFPAYLIDQRMTPESGMMALALIGLFNIFGTYFWGWLGQHYTKKYVLSVLYFTRAVTFAIFLSMPLTPLSVYLFSSAIGFLWLGTVPVTSGLIAQVFGVKYLATLTGIAFLFHQVGSFFGVWIAGYLFDATGSYRLMWLLTIALGVLAGLINLPINDSQIVRPAMRPA
ncbi:MAG: MFS transporter [Betaproteobacteria bacterium]|nr:MFS transporter [Betaproteobacteria bacterium]